MSCEFTKGFKFDLSCEQIKTPTYKIIGNKVYENGKYFGDIIKEYVKEGFSFVYVLYNGSNKYMKGETFKIKYKS